MRLPSDTCNTRSAVCAILRLWVIIMMVCSYFLDASFSRAMTSLLFWVSRLPVGCVILVQKENHSKATACRGFLLLLSFLQFCYTSYISALVLFLLLQTVCSTLFCTPGIYSNYELCSTSFLSLFLPRQFLPGVPLVLLFYCFHNIVIL